MSDGHLMICIAVAITVLSAVLQAFREKTMQIDIVRFLGNLGNATTMTTGALITYLSLSATDDAVLKIADNRLGLAIGGLVMLIYGINQLSLMFGKQATQNADVNNNPTTSELDRPLLPPKMPASEEPSSKDKEDDQVK